MNTEEIVYEDIRMEVEFDYTPYEPTTFWNPGVDEDVSVYSVRVGGQEISQVLSKDTTRDIEIHVLDLISKRRQETAIENAA